MNIKKKPSIFFSGLLLVLLCFSSCGPINYFTRIKKVPREYSLNYCGDVIKAPASPINKEAWVVFSDRDDNYTYQNPGGKVKFKKTSFLEPFFVIKTKGDYVKLVKYDPTIVESGLLSKKIKDKKKAEYYGWMHKSHLVLNRYSTTDIASGFQDKNVVMISDTLAISSPELFLTKDSIKVFKDPNLSIPSDTIAMYDIVYTLKTSKDRTKQLIASVPQVSPDSISSQIYGWTLSGLVDNIGQRLFVDSKIISTDDFLFKDKNKCDTLHVSDTTVIDNRFRAQSYKPLLKYTPVTDFCETADSLRVKLKMPMSVINQNNNYIYNINGNKIYYNQFRKLEEDINQFNILFVFEAKKDILDNFPAMINVVQNLQPFFEEQKDNVNYNFGAIVAAGDAKYDQSMSLRKQKLTNSYDDILEFLIKEAETIDKFSPLPTDYTWSGVREATEILSSHKGQTNLMIILGESGYAENVDSILVRKIADINTRILGFQLHSTQDNEGNNFALQVQNLINYYGDYNKKAKREKLVFMDQFNNNSRYKEVDRNVYALDFPKRSMSQGWVLFPDKESVTPLDLLASSVDSIVSEINLDNQDIINNMTLAFNSVGNHRYTYDSVFTNYFKPHLPIKKRISSYFSKVPLWYISSNQISLAKNKIEDSIKIELEKPNFRLLLTKEELGELVEFVDRLAAREPDYKYKGKKDKSKKLCNCPDDDFEEENPMLDSSGNPEYRSTRGIRKYLKNVYMNKLKECKLCKIKKKQLLSYNLGYAQEKITGCPTYNTLLNKYHIKDIQNKKTMSDKELDDLILYFKSKSESLHNYLRTADSFDSGGRLYYWITQDLLP